MTISGRQLNKFKFCDQHVLRKSVEQKAGHKSKRLTRHHEWISSNVDSPNLSKGGNCGGETLTQSNTEQVILFDARPWDLHIRGIASYSPTINWKNSFRYFWPSPILDLRTTRFSLAFFVADSSNTAGVWFKRRLLSLMRIHYIAPLEKRRETQDFKWVFGCEKL